MNLRNLLWASLLSLVALTARAETVVYVHTDVLGSPVLETDANAKVVRQVDYRAYGDEVLGAPRTGPGYTGHYRDESTGLVYAQQRYYDPAVGRFISPDPIDASPIGGENFNRYKYAANSPFGFVDLDGMYESPLWMRTTVPGQVAFDNSITALEDGNPVGALAWTGAMLTEQALTVLTGGGSFATKQATVIGGVGLSKNLIKPSVGGVVRRFQQQGDRMYYRVYSDGATVGDWVTAIPPRSSLWAREALALPPRNRATCIQEVLVPDGTWLERSRAIRQTDWERFHYGAEQFHILEKLPPSNYGAGMPLP